jgi:DNA polymerase-3 subunit gamma/tau
MSYLVLARKWRPQTFEEVVGQRHVTRTLQNALRNNRIAHALLFSGARGVGKTSVARILAKAINCEQGNLADPCNRCEVCREITAGSAVDVQEIDGASNRGIDEIRQLRENIRFHPSRCKYRVYIIDEVHMLTKEAFNALLKTLEEPPPHVYFIFATTEPQKIPSTIHSRCQHYEFRRIGTTELADHLDGIAKAEGYGLNRDATLLLAREAEGSARDGLSLLDQVKAYGAVSLEEVCEALGVVGSQVFKELAISILRRDIPKALELVDEVHAFGVDLNRFALELAAFFRNLVVLKNLGPQRSRNLVDLGSEELDELEAQLSEFTPQSLFQILDALIKGQEAIHKSSTPKISLEVLIIRLCHMAEVVGIDTLLRQVDSLLASPAAGTTAESPRPAGKAGDGIVTKPAERTESVSKRVDLDAWSEFLDFVRAKRPPLASLLGCCEDFHVEENGQVRLRCRPGMQLDLLGDKDNLDRLNDLCREFFGRRTDVIVEAGPRRDEAEKPGEKTCQRRDELIQLPLVQEAIKVFQARIAEVKILSGQISGETARDRDKKPHQRD